MLCQCLRNGQSKIHRQMTHFRNKYVKFEINGRQEKHTPLQNIPRNFFGCFNSEYFCVKNQIEIIALEFKWICKNKSNCRRNQMKFKSIRNVTFLLLASGNSLHTTTTAHLCVYGLFVRISVSAFGSVCVCLAQKVKYCSRFHVGKMTHAFQYTTNE